MAFAADDVDQDRERRSGVPLFSGRGLLVALLIAALFTAATLFVPLNLFGSLTWLGSLDPLTPWIAPAAAVAGFMIGLVGYKLVARGPAIPEESAIPAEDAAKAVVAAGAEAAPIPEAVAPEPVTAEDPPVTPLADLGVVQLVERLALALQRWSARDLAIPASLRDDLAALVPSNGRA